MPDSAIVTYGMEKKQLSDEQMEGFFPFHFLMRRSRDMLQDKISASQFLLRRATKVSSKMGEACITHKKVTNPFPCSSYGRILEVAGYFMP